jgi:gas vesicle protein
MSADDERDEREDEEDDVRDDREVVIETGGSGFRWFVLGAAVGAAVGLLFAPQAGERTRHDLKRRAQRIRSRAGERLEDLSVELQERGARLRDSVDDLVDDVGETVREGRDKVTRAATGAREEMERRLTEARSRRRSAISSDDAADGDA